MKIQAINQFNNNNQYKKTVKNSVNCSFTAKGIYPGSFDPITIGHTNIIERAAKFLDEVIVFVGINPEKVPFLSIDQRVNLIKKTVKPMKNVSVASSEGYTVEYAKKSHSDVIVRAIRNNADYEFEQKLMIANKKLAPSIDTILLPADPALENVSSSLIRDMYKEGSDYSKLVPDCVRQTLNLKNTLDTTTQRLGFTKEGSKSVFDDFMKAYDNPNREYHGLGHVEDMINGYSTYKNNGLLQVQNEDEFIYSIFMHDFVNGVEGDVQKSAQYAVNTLQHSATSNTTYVNKLIMATDYANKPQITTFDEALIQDLDLSVLGKSNKEYQNYSSQIRQQYAKFDDNVYNPERIRVLQGFLDKEHIYNTEYFRQNFEAQARQNIQHEIQSLS